MSTEKQISQQSYADADDRIETGETPPESTLDALHDALAAPEPLTVADLSARHIGQKIRVLANDGDVLTGYVEDLGFYLERQAQGVVVEAVRIEFQHGTAMYPLTATVEVL